MIDIKNIFSDVKYLHLDRHEDDRGFFSEIYKEREFRKVGIENQFVQQNLSFSKKRNTLRGMHFQSKPFAQSKMIKVLKGSIFDVFIDLRKNSKDFQSFGYYNLSENDGWLFIPQGFAHGFLTTSDNTLITYKVDNYFDKSSEKGIIWNDDFYNIPWPKKSELIISDKDLLLPSWEKIADESF